MTDSEEMHYSVADADDLEKPCGTAIPLLRFSKRRTPHSASDHQALLMDVVPERTPFYFSVL
jgi:hypothetical protein